MIWLLLHYVLCLQHRHIKFPMLKKLLLLFITITSLVIVVNAQQLPVNLRNSATTIPFRVASTSETVRPLTEVNGTAAENGYPYLSGDGLRLYCIEHDTGYYVYSRATTADTFAYKKSIGISLLAPNGIWLSPDEKSIFYQPSGEGDINFISRTDTSLPFNSANAQSVTLTNISPTATTLGISLTADTQQMFLFLDYYNMVLRFTKVNGYLEYLLADTIATNAVGPGQISKDGLTYYYSIAANGLTSALAYITRPDLNSQFTQSPTLLDTLINNPNLSYPEYYEPTVSSDETIIVYIKTGPAGWNSNNFYMASNVTSQSAITSFTSASANIVFSIYPNPSAGSFNIQLNGNGNYTATVSNGIGTVIKTAVIGSTLTPIDMSNATSGIYYVTVSGDNGSATQKLVVQ